MLNLDDAMTTGGAGDDEWMSGMGHAEAASAVRGEGVSGLLQLTSSNRRMD